MALGLPENATDHKVDLAFKKLINKEFTDNTVAFFAEFSADTLDISAREIYTQTIPSTPPSLADGATNGDGSVKYYELFPLQKLPGFDAGANNRKVWYFCSGAGYNPDPDTGDGFDRTFAQRNFISPKYGAEYEIEIFKDPAGGSANKIGKTDETDWYFDYKTGILSVQDPDDGVGTGDELYVTLYQYVGETLDEKLTSIVDEAQSGQSGIFSPTGSYQSTSNNVQVTGSFEVNGTIDATGIITSIGGFSGSLDGNNGDITNVNNINATNVTATQGTFTDLTVTGTTTTVNTTNLNIEDQFILINSGALSAVGYGADNSDKDGGLIVDFGGGSGSALFYDADKRAWSIKGTDHTSATQTDFLAYNVTSSNVNDLATSDYVISVVSTDGANPTAVPTYGNSEDEGVNSHLGTMHINNSDGTIWIYS